MKVLIGTKNPGKIEGATKALSHYFEETEVIGYKVPSNVSDEPVNEETYIGALNRVNNLIELSKKENIEADLFMAIESGITNQLGKWMIVNMAVIKDSNGYESWGCGAGIPVPDSFVDDIINKSLGTVMDELFNSHNLSTGVGGVSFLTNNSISRIDITEQAFTMALCQYANNHIWSDIKLTKKQ